MPTVEVSAKDLSQLIGKKMNQAELEDALMFVKGEVDAVENGMLKIDIKDTNRPDLWSAEGIARELRARIGKEKGVPKYKMSKSGVELYIDQSVLKARPLMIGAVVRDVKITEDFLVQMIQLQEKLGLTYGRKRKELGLGLYDLDRMKPPFYYKGVKPRALKFIPLEFERELDLDEILELHPKGKEYGHLLQHTNRYPIVMDSENVVASMPPIINSEHSGKVTEKTKNIFVEATGWREDVLNVSLNVMVSALAERGGKIEQIKIIPPKGKAFYSPNFTPKKGKVALDFVRRISGFNWKKEEVVKLLRNARYDATGNATTIKVEYPAYRGDILHPVDIVEDLLIGKGYNNIEPIPIEMAVIGEERAETQVQEQVREACIGLGLQEILTFTMSSIEKQQEKIQWKNAEFVEIANPVSSNWQVMRRSVIPEMLDFLAKNKDVSYPQRIFEVGKCVIPHLEKETKVDELIKLGVAFSDTKVGFTEIKSALNEITQYLGLDISLKRIQNPAFTEGRCAEIKSNGKKGIIGELNDSTRKNFGIDNSVSVFEITL